MSSAVSHIVIITKKLLQFCLLSFLITTILWYVIEVPMLEKLPSIMYNTLGVSVYGSQRIDERGIPYLIYPKLGKQYNPLFIANQASDYHTNLTIKNSKAGFINCTDWLEANLKIENKSAFAQYNFPNLAYKLGAPWSSAMTQVAVANVLIKRYTFSHEAKWLEMSRQMLNPLLPGQSNLVLRLKDKSYWYEEYPSLPSSYVLNGMMSVLLNLHKYYVQTSDSLALNLFDNGYNALIQKLPSYDGLFMSKYDLQGRIASMAYHKVHIHQLKELNKIRQNNILQHYITKWQSYILVPAPIQLLFNFKPMRFLAFSIVWLCITLLIYFTDLLIRLKQNKRKQP